MNPNIIYTDEQGVEHKVGGDRSKKFSVVVIIAGMIVLGALGGVAGTIITFNNPALRSVLGLSKGFTAQTPLKKNIKKVVVEESSAVIDVSEKVAKSVVSITTKRDVVDFFGQVVTQKGGGTGFIVTSDGLIVTNKHVVSDPEASYTVFTSDGKDYPAKIVATDPLQDMAVLKIEARGLPVVELGDSDELRVGQRVVAIGNALGQFKNTVTTGVISAKEREIEAGGAAGGSEKLEGLLQTDAAINQGNSGGPLLNLAGQVVGINTAVAAKGVAEGIGFAIPINSVKNSIKQVVKSGSIKRAYLGVRYIPLTKEIARSNGLKVSSGAWLMSSPTEPAVVPGSPAAKAGLKNNDIILKVDNQKITENRTLSRILATYSVGDKATLKILRDDKEIKVEVVLEELK